MLNKICAGLLLVLILSPFTAPFSTCDLATIMGRAAGTGAPSRRTPFRAAAATADTAVSLVPFSRLARSHRLKDRVAVNSSSSLLVPAPTRVRHRSHSFTAPLAPDFALTTILRL